MVKFYNSTCTTTLAWNRSKDFFNYEISADESKRKHDILRAQRFVRCLRCKPNVCCKKGRSGSLFSGSFIFGFSSLSKGLTVERLKQFFAKRRMPMVRVYAKHSFAAKLRVKRYHHSSARRTYTIFMGALEKCVLASPPSQRWQTILC